MRIENLVISTIVLVVVITIGASLYMDQQVRYNPGEDTTMFNKILNKTDSYINKTPYELQGTTQGQPTSDEDTEAAQYRDNVPAIKSIFASVGIAASLLSLFHVETNLVPPIIISALNAILIVLAGVFIIYMIARFKPQN